jgi:hypothetical protein
MNSVKARILEALWAIVAEIHAYLELAVQNVKDLEKGE